MVLDPADIPATGLDVITADYVQESESLGFFVNAELEVGDTITLIAGGRYSHDKRSFNGVDTNVSFDEPLEIVSLNQTDKDDRLTWKVGVEWQPAVDTLVFANVSTSYKAGTFYGAAVLDDAAWSFIDPEKVLSYELGLKQTLFDGNMQFNASLFRLEYDDRQSLVAFVADDFSDFLLVPVVDTTLINIPKSVSQGFEMDLQWFPADGFEISAGFVYLDAEITRGPAGAVRGISLDTTANDLATGDSDGDGLINNGEVGFVDALTGSVAGGPLSQAPKISFNIIGAYEHEITDHWTGRFQLAYSYVDDQIAQLSDVNAQYGPVESLDAIIAFTNENNGFSIGAYGKNITSNSAETYAFSSFAGRAVYRQKPVEYGIRAGLDF